MSLNMAAGEFMEAIVHNGQFYRVPGRLRIGKTVAISYLTIGTLVPIVNQLKELKRVNLRNRVK